MKRLITISFFLCLRIYAANYSTSFPTVETPISEGGKWYNTMSVSSDWSNVVVAVSGKAQGKNGHDTSDSVAVLTGTWGADQDASGIVWRDSNLGATNFPELEVLINMTPGWHSMAGYEALFSMSVALEDSFLGRWNGPPGNFTSLADCGAGAVLNGNTVRFVRNGSTLTMYVNGSSIGSVSDSTYLNGAPGIGMDSNLQTYDYSVFGFTSYTATDGISSKITLGVAGSKLGPHKL